MQDDQGSIRIRLAQTGEESSVDMGTLYEWITSGKATAGHFVNGKLLTDGEWRRLGDMAIYYVARKERTPEWVTDHRVEGSPSIPSPYSALRLISSLCKIAAVIVVLGTIIIVFQMGSVLSNVPSGAVGSVGGLAVASALVKDAIAALLLWALGELIPLWIDMEENTRRAAKNTGPQE